MSKKQQRNQLDTTSRFFKKKKNFDVSNNKRDIKVNTYIISGGKNTEKYYFTHINKLTEYSFKIKPKYFGTESNYYKDFPKHIKEILKDEPEAKIFCVFDFDTIKNTLKNKEHYNEFCKITSEYKNVNNCCSMPSFEYWLLLHFENTKTLMNSCSEVSSKLKKYLGDYNKTEEDLKTSTWVKKLIENNQLKMAIDRAKNNIEIAKNNNNLDNISYSYVYKIFE